MKKITFYSIIFFGMLILLMNNACNKKDSVTDYNNDLPTTPVKINSLSTTIALPASQLVITGSGFSSTDNLSVRFSHNISYQVDVPVLQSSSTSLIVSVPPFITSDNAPFLIDTVNIQIIKKSGTGTVESNKIEGFCIRNLPSSIAVPGIVTLNFLNWEINNYINIQQEIKGTEMDTPSLNNAISDNLSNLQSLAAKVKIIVNAPSSVFSLGSINGVTLNIGSKEMLQCDRYILAMFSALSSMEVSPSLHSQNISSQDILSKLNAVPCPSEALAQFEELQNPGGYSDNSHYDCVVSSVPDAIAAAYKVVAGAGTAALGILALAGAPAIALALPSAAIIYATVMTSGMQITIGSSLKNIDNKAALAAIHAGVDQIEDMCTGMLVGTVLPHAAGAVKDIYNGFKSLSQAFISTPATDCSYSLSEYSKPFISSGGSGSVSVIAAAGCTWTAASEAAWITVTSGSSGSGNGTVAYSVKANSSNQQRTGSINIADKMFTITQEGSVNQSGSFNGDWAGTFNGIYTGLSGSTWEYKDQQLSLTIWGTKIYGGAPSLGSGNIDASGNAAWGNTGERNSSFSFTGTFSSDGSASGTWTQTILSYGQLSGSGQGTWTATRQ